MKHQKDIVELRIRNAEKKNQLREKLEEVAQEAAEIQKEKEILDQKARILNTKRKLLTKHQNMLRDDSNHLGGSLIINQLDLTKSLSEKDSEEKTNLESLQQRFYGETVKMANLEEDIDKIT